MADNVPTVGVHVRGRSHIEPESQSHSGMELVSIATCSHQSSEDPWEFS